MLSDENALRQSQRLEELGFDMSPQRLQQIRAGARPKPDEREAARLAEVVSAIDNGISPEEAAAADIRRENLHRVVVVTLVVSFALLLILLFALTY